MGVGQALGGSEGLTESLGETDEEQREFWVKGSMGEESFKNNCGMKGEVVCLLRSRGPQHLKLFWLKQECPGTPAGPAFIPWRRMDSGGGHPGKSSHLSWSPPSTKVSGLKP